MCCSGFGTLADPSFDISELATGTLLSRGYQGEVYLTCSGAQRLVTKKAMGVFPVRIIREYMLRREYSIYQRLEGIAGVPRCFGLHDGKLLVLEYIESQSFRESGRPPKDRQRFFSEMLKIIQSLHQAGIAHADMKRKDNILINTSGSPYLIDFGAAVALRESGGFLNRFFFKQACRMDLNAWVKLKYRNRFDNLSEADRHFYQPTTMEKWARTMRPLWQAVTFRRWRKTRRNR